MSKTYRAVEVHTEHGSYRTSASGIRKPRRGMAAQSFNVGRYADCTGDGTTKRRIARRIAQRSLMRELTKVGI